jgi:hypothetical protein
MSKQAKNQKSIKNVNKKKEKNSDIVNLFAFGYLDLTLIIEFYENDLKDREGKKIKIEDINDISKLDFIKDNKKLINRIQVESENDFIKQFLLLNKMSKGKKQIEFFPFYSPQFNGNNQFFRKIFDEVMNKYDILINKKSLDKNQGYSLKIKLKHKEKTNLFEYVSSDKETDNIIAEESCNNNNSNKEYDENEGEETEAMKKGLIPNFKNKECIFRKLNPSCQKYDLMYIIYKDLKNIEGGFEEEDFIELVKFFKKKKTKIFVNYYKPSKSELVEPREEEDNNDEDNNDEDGENNAETNDNTNENQSEEKNENNNEEESNKEKSKNSKKFANQKKLNLLYKITDIFFFDEKQAYGFFDRHLKYYNKKKSKTYLSKAKIYDYFISSIAGNSEDSEEKIGLFLKDIENFIIIECSNNKGTKEILDSKLYPKKTTRNIELINKYKTIIQENKDEYYNIFTACMLEALFNNSNGLLEEINISFTNALNIIKKTIECQINNVEFDINKFINYKTIQTENMENRKNYAQKGKEKGFILDCMNQEKSKLKEYVPLKDQNLKWYFRSKSNMKYLVKRGFVDKKGYIMYDKEYRKTLGSPKNLSSKISNKQTSNLEKYISELTLYDNVIKEEVRTKEKIPK